MDSDTTRSRKISVRKNRNQRVDCVSDACSGGEVGGDLLVINRMPRLVLGQGRSGSQSRMSSFGNGGLKASGVLYFSRSTVLMFRNLWPMRGTVPSQNGNLGANVEPSPPPLSK